MAPLKTTRLYYFSVEGETEQWYLEWLQDLINSSSPEAKVKFNIQVQKDPLKRAKGLSMLSSTKKMDIYHFSDYESDDPEHVKNFNTTMDRMNEANKIGKSIRYVFGYSNLTFDLWMVLHKANCNGSLTHRKNYLTPINRAYNEHFEDMDHFKSKDNFKRCLGKLNLSNVIEAVNRSKQIMKRNHDNGYILHEYKGYKYYKENPSLEVGTVIEKILKSCGLC